MRLSKYLKITLLIIVFLAVLAYVAYAFFGMKSTNPDEICDDVVFLFEEESEDAIVDSTSAANMMVEADIYPKGKKMGSIDLMEIEKLLSKNVFVTSVNCYGSNNGMDVGKGRLCIKISQMVPMMLVFDNNNTHYYVDSLGNIIESDSLYAKNLMVANGEINRNYVVSTLAPFVAFVRQDDFWDSQIEQVYVEYDKNKERVVTLIPRVGDQRIFMGTLDNYENKLKRLRKFYERGLSVVGWNKYSVLNLEYDNQVVGIIKGHEQKIEVNDEEENQGNATEVQNSEANKNEAKKEEPKQEVKKEEPKQEVKKEEPKKEEPKKEAKKEEPKQEKKN